MAAGKSTIEILWGGAGSKAVLANTDEPSDAASMPTNAVGARLFLEADNGGTPAAADQMYFAVSYKGQNVNNLADDKEHADQAKTLDTNLIDPARGSIDISPHCAEVVVHARGTIFATTNTITVKAWIEVTTA